VRDDLLLAGRNHADDSPESDLKHDEFTHGPKVLYNPARSTFPIWNKSSSSRRVSH